MRLLGLTDLPGQVPGVAFRPVAGLFAAFASHGAAPDPRGRLRLQVVCARTLRSFLPVSPAFPCAPERLERWLPGQSGPIAARLRDLRWRAQVTIALSRSGDRPLPPDVSWLARRMAERRDLTGALAALETLSRGYGAVETVAEERQARLHVLCARTDLPRLRSGLEKNMGSGALEGWHATVTGPWPALAFAARRGA
jgi:hypothetical protein